MSFARDPHANAGKRNYSNQQYFEYNKTFTSKTSDHYKNKLSQLGIEKDLREILERKRLQKNEELNSDGNDISNTTQRKVRFDESHVPIRRSKSFTSGITKKVEKQDELDKHTKGTNSTLRKFSSFKGKKNDFVDLKNPTNIKVEFKLQSGERKCTVDSAMPLKSVKCDIKNSRNILKQGEQKEMASQSKSDRAEKKERNKYFKPMVNESQTEDKNVAPEFDSIQRKEKNRFYNSANEENQPEKRKDHKPPTDNVHRKDKNRFYEHPKGGYHKSFNKRERRVSSKATDEVTTKLEESLSEMKIAN